MTPRSLMRLLIVEDDDARVRTLRSWLPGDIRVVVANTAGAAIGILRNDPGHVYCGVMLDHDLQQHRYSDADRQLCGQDVVEAAVRYLDRSVPIVIHSVNTVGRHAMGSRLRQAGFSVDILPIDDMTREALKEWIDEIRANGYE